MCDVFYPTTPTFTEKDLPSQQGKVFIVTGSSSGFGKELAKLLYQLDAKVYVATRSETKAKAAIDEIRSLHPRSKGELVFLQLDLGDLSTIRTSAQEFLSKETRLDVLWNNAGVMVPPEGSKTAQGYEQQLGVNAIGTFLFTQLMYPLLALTAKSAPKGSVRVAWTASRAATSAPDPAIDFSNINYERKAEKPMAMYQRSKAGTVILAAELARRAASEGVLSVSIEPGVATTDLQRTMAGPLKLAVKVLGYEPIMGAYTELWAGLAPEVPNEYKEGLWVVPAGRFRPCREDFFAHHIGRVYWEWMEQQVRQYY